MTDNDLDKKFQEDLEKARALSLETLALEKFRIQKEQEEKKKGNFTISSYGLIISRQVICF